MLEELEYIHRAGPKQSDAFLARPSDEPTFPSNLAARDGLEGGPAWRDPGLAAGFLVFLVYCVRLVTYGQDLRFGEIGALGYLEKKPEAGRWGMPKLKAEFDGSGGTSGACGPDLDGRRLSGVLSWSV